MEWQGRFSTQYVNLSDPDAAVDALFHPTALDENPRDEYELYLSFPIVWDWYVQHTPRPCTRTTTSQFDRASSRRLLLR